MFLNGILKRLAVTLGYIANYGYTDGSGDWYIIVNTDKCNGCGDCIEPCPQNIFEVITDDYDDKVLAVKRAHHKNLKYLCAPCKPVSGRKELPCVAACPNKAITHSW